MPDYLYTFVGRVLPERTYVTINDGKSMEFSLEDQDWGLSCKVSISIAYAQVSAVVTSTTPIADLETLKNTISDLVAIVVDAFAYLEGRGYGVEIISLIMPDGTQRVFSIEILALQQDKGNRLLSLGDLIHKGMLNQPSDTSEQAFHRQSLRYALADLRQAILSPKDTSFLCYRAIDGIMQGFKESQGTGKDEDKAWGLLRSALQVDETPLIDLAKKASTHRHGYHLTITGYQRVFAMMFAWRIVDRFALYIAGGFQPLSESAFGILHS